MPKEIYFPEESRENWSARKLAGQLAFAGTATVKRKDKLNWPQMNADKTFCFHQRLSAFICGQICLAFFRPFSASD
jgi:hypothetical protein